MKIDKIFVFLVTFAVLIGIFYGAYYIPNMIRDTSTIWYRFSHSFVGMFTILPITVIGSGIFIIIDAVVKRPYHGNEISNKLVFCGFLMIMIGFGLFGFYLVD